MMSHPIGDDGQSAVDPDRRIALIMVNSFSGTNGDRTDAANYDYNSMMSLWRDTLGCKIFCESGKDLTAQQMSTALRNFSKTREEFKYVVVVICTHGGLVAESFAEHPEPVIDPNNILIEQNRGYEAYKAYGKRADKGYYDHEPMTPVFFGNDFRPVREKEMKEMFYNNSAVGLQDVPKIFILDYCRGDMIDYGVIRVPRPTSALAVKFDDSQSPESRATRDHEIQPPSLMPLVSDAIAIYATHESTTAWQNNPDMGSWLTSEIERVFAKPEEDDDLLQLMTKVNKNMKSKTVEVEERGQKRYLKAMSVFESSLTTKVYLK